VPTSTTMVKLTVVVLVAHRSAEVALFPVALDQAVRLEDPEMLHHRLLAHPSSLDSCNG
jgi:hypothetical protein